MNRIPIVSRSTSQLSPRKSGGRDPREVVKWCFVHFAIFVLVLIVMLLITRLMRAIMGGVGTAIFVGIPATIVEVYHDPWLIIAFILAVLFVWSRPWEEFGIDFSSWWGGEDKPRVRRGSELERSGRWGRRHTDQD